MTSPAQLKYLDAMGIPVWVSRDLLLDNVSSDVAGDTLAVDDPAVNLINQLQTQAEDVSSNSNIDSSTPEREEGGSVVNIPDFEKQENEVGRTPLHAVYACGSLQADWMVIGESPEVNHDRLNQPYAGDSGKLLTNMLRAVGVEEPRRDAYLMNIIKSSGRVDQNIEVSAATELNQLLHAKIQEVKPKMLLVVGQIAAQNLLRSSEPLARLRAKVHRLPDSDLPLIVTYYPSYLLSKPLDKRKAWEDLQLAMRLLEKTV